MESAYVDWGLIVVYSLYGPHSHKPPYIYIENPGNPGYLRIRSQHLTPDYPHTQSPSRTLKCSVSSVWQANGSVNIKNGEIGPQIYKIKM